ncbi:MAG: hypothetical protein N2511_04795 [Thermodesulfovibrionales bacterium]|nr:hypothetical protein [Thermodesulfovibrionales bacterium]
MDVPIILNGLTDKGSLYFYKNYLDQQEGLFDRIFNLIYSGIQNGIDNILSIKDIRQNGDAQFTEDTKEKEFKGKNLFPFFCGQIIGQNDSVIIDESTNMVRKSSLWNSVTFHKDFCKNTLIQGLIGNHAYSENDIDIFDMHKEFKVTTLKEHPEYRIDGSIFNNIKGYEASKFKALTEHFFRLETQKSFIMKGGEEKLRNLFSDKESFGRSNIDEQLFLNEDMKSPHFILTGDVKEQATKPLKAFIGAFGERFPEEVLKIVADNVGKELLSKGVDSSSSSIPINNRWVIQTLRESLKAFIGAFGERFPEEVLKIVADSEVISALKGEINHTPQLFEQKSTLTEDRQGVQKSTLNNENSLNSANKYTPTANKFNTPYFIMPQNKSFDKLLDISPEKYTSVAPSTQGSKIDDFVIQKENHLFKDISLTETLKVFFEATGEAFTEEILTQLGNLKTDIIDFIENSIHFIKANDSVIKIKVSKEELGLMDIEVCVDSGLINTTIIASESTTKLFLENNLTNILNYLLKEGLNIGKFSVFLGDKRGNGSGSNDSKNNDIVQVLKDFNSIVTSQQTSLINIFV